MRIIFNTDQIYLHGGIEKVMAEKATYFADVCGYEVVILTCEQRGNIPCYSMSSKIQFLDLGVNYERSKSYFSVTNLLKVPRHLYQLQKSLHRLNADAVIVSNYGFDYYAMPFLHSKSKKIKEFHSSRYFENQQRNTTKSIRKKLFYKFNDWIESRYNRLVILNKDEVPFYQENAIVIPNPITISSDVAILEKKQVVAAGRISPVKGFDKLINAWHLVHQQMPDWELHFYGTDYLQTQNKLEALIKDLNLEKSIFFKGSSNTMNTVFTDYSLYVMSSVSECFPMVLLESLAVGLPIVSFDCPTGPGNIVSDGKDGFLAISQNSDDLAKKILLLLQDKELRLQFGQNAKQNSLQFSTAVVMKK